MNGQHAFPSPSGMALRLPHLLSLAGVLAVVGLMLYPVGPTSPCLWRLQCWPCWDCA